MQMLRNSLQSFFAVREEKRKYEEACKVWREECVRAEIEATKDGQYYGNVSFA